MRSEEREGTVEKEEGRAGLFKEREWSKSREVWFVRPSGETRKGWTVSTREG